MSKVLSIAQLNGYLEEIFENEELLHGVRVKGELTSWSLARKTLFFALQDEENRLNCIHFDYCGPDLPEGGSVVVTGTPVYSKKHGTLRFHARSIAPAGPGEMRERFRLLTERLEREGLFSAARKIPVPSDCPDVGVITSKSGAVIHDIIVTARRRNPAVNIRLYPVRVQGAGAELEIEDALRAMDTPSEPSGVLIVARGGGAAEELEIFNSETLARAVAACKKPVVSAVGHETDYTLCDLAADLRVPTPTAAAVAVTADRTGALAELKLRSRLLRGLMLNLLAAKTSTLRNVSGALSSACNAILNARAYETARYARAAKSALTDLYRERLSQTEALKIALKGADPLAVLERGYARLFKDKTITGVAEVEPGDLLDVVLSDGTLKTRVLEKRQNGVRKERRE
ncbi:MAG: exodeoxyribonuclease VII large subunit [Clostridiales bacterium]|jgi:exodeoxyribonuclease VII large subunit|nr:exodeoxyribonuclease VII large subunit [Clostridiales bacterium]